ncbi:MAG: four helix bundle protein [Bacteroidota bacterium]
MKNNFEKLNIWKDAVELAVQVNELMSDSKYYSLKDQMLRSSISVPSNIAEGCERQYPKEFERFLTIAAGSCGEIRTQLILAARFKEIDESESLELLEKYRSLSAQIFSSKKKVKQT